MEKKRGIHNYIEEHIFHSEDFLIFSAELLNKGIITGEEFLFLQWVIQEEEIKDILKIWIQAEGLYHLIERPVAFWIAGLVGISLSEISFSSLSKGVLEYLVLITPAIMTTRYAVLKILTSFQNVPQSQHLIKTGMLPLPTPLILALWFKKYGVFLKTIILYSKTKDVRKKISQERDETKKSELEKSQEGIIKTTLQWIQKYQKVSEELFLFKEKILQLVSKK